MTTAYKELIEEFRDELKIRIKDIFIWAKSDAAMTDVTKTVRDNNQNRIEFNNSYSFFG